MIKRSLMRTSDRVAMFIMLVSAACDKPEPPKPEKAATTPTAAASGSAKPADAGASRMPKPERPIPKPDNTVAASMPIEVQQKAIAYMVAMRAPSPDDANSDPAYAADLAAKLKPIILSMDNGADKARMNRVEVVANGRQIDLLMSGGCDDKTPVRAVVSRAMVPFSTLAAHGVFVVRCNDAKIQCLQSTREPDDVLCTTAPRHK